MAMFKIFLSKYENTQSRVQKKSALREFHIRREVREACGLGDSLFSLRGNVVLADIRQARELAMMLNSRLGPHSGSEQFVRAGQLNAMGLIDEILHYMISLYREQVKPDLFNTALERLGKNLGPEDTNGVLTSFGTQFPPKDVYTGKTTVDNYLNGEEAGESCRSLSLEEILLLALANLNPAFRPFYFLFDDSDLAKKSNYPGAIEELKAHLSGLPVFGPDGMNLWDLLRAPALASPDSLLGQLEYMRKNWGLLIGKYINRLLTGLDVIKEEDKPFFGGSGPTQAPDYSWLENEYERFSPDQDWMPRTVLMAKSTLVWLFQLSQKYGREITRLDQIPDEELDELARKGFTGLWLIGLWERSQASKTVKQWTGNPEAAASAYSLHDYDIAGELGGWEALKELRGRCMRRGIRLGSDMVPNHTGLDSRWVMEHPDRFLQLGYIPFPAYTFNGGNLSNRDEVGIYIEDHYYNRTDAAVVFKRVDFNTGDVRYIYHGNDGTSMPWNDTAQIDFLNPEAREAVIRTIIGVCQQFSIVRFDAAMTLAKRHIQRLWYPEPGKGGDIASRSEHAISSAEFNHRIPNEFWREVVDRCAAEAPHTLLLAEAFWMMEGYFVRTLGMHRVYNSAFMNMLKNEENAKYRATIKNTLEFDPEVLKRFVNFMNNPDEETAVAQFGKGDKYFGIATLLVTMPGLPMFGHGQIEGFEEKYGMEYRRSYRDEKPDQYLVDRHEREIFPLMKKRYIFSGSADFVLYDLAGPDGNINENVFAYSNSAGSGGTKKEKALVIYNNSFSRGSGWIRCGAVAIPQKDGTFRQDDLCAALGLHNEDRYFTVLREQRSGHRFIRSSKELAERGLFVDLKGYEAQVFLDIHELADEENAAANTWNARWARLNHELNGRGVWDLESAVLDIYLAELYAPLEEILKPDLISGLWGKEKKKNLEMIKEPVLSFVKAAAEYINGVEGGYPAFMISDEDGESRPYPKVPEPDPVKIWNEFSAFISNSEPAQNRCQAPIVSYGLISLLRSVLGGSTGAAVDLLVDHWKLLQKLEAIGERFGIGQMEARRIGDIARAVLIRTSPKHSSRKPGRAIPSADNTDEVKSFTADLIRENYHAVDFRKLLGVNHFDDVTWFNKEAFEEVLFWASQFIFPESAVIFNEPERIAAEDYQKRARLVRAVVSGLRRAEELSGFRLDGLLEALSSEGGQGSSGSPVSEKNQAGKKPAAKDKNKKGKSPQRKA